MAALSGELAQGVLPGVLRTLYVERRTGLLHVTREGERGSVCFVSGNIVYGDTTIKECQLGDTLVRHGILTQWDRERAGEMVSVTGRRLGEILLDLGLLDADGLEDALALQVREVLLTIFSWPDGAYAFDDQDGARFRGYDKPLRLSTAEVILDAVWSIADPDVVRFALGDLQRVLTPASDPLLRFQRITLSPTDGFILSRVDGSLTAREILALAPGEAEEAERSLFGLLHIGMVEFLKPAPKVAPGSSAALRRSVLAAFHALPRQNHFEMLGVARTATSSELLAPYFRLAKLYHPDQHHQPGLHDLKDVLEALFARVGEAHRVLSDARARSAYERSLQPLAEAAPSAPPPPPEPPSDPMKIDEALDRAEQALAGNQVLETFNAVESVIAGATGRARRRARLLRAQAYLRSSGGAKAAEEELKTALAEDAAHPEAHFLLGTLYRAGGASALAAASFRRALALKPRYAEAEAELRALGPEAPAGAPGVLRRFLRK